MVPKSVRNRVRPGPLLSSKLPQRSQLRCRARKLAAWALTMRSWMPTNMALELANDRPIASSRSSSLSKCRISSSLITLLSSPMIRNWIWIRMLVPKAVTVRAPTYLPTPSRTIPISHTLPCSRLKPGPELHWYVVHAVGCVGLGLVLHLVGGAEALLYGWPLLALALAIRWADVTFRMQGFEMYRLVPRPLRLQA